jgi:hypothetical protein
MTLIYPFQCQSRGCDHQYDGDPSPEALEAAGWLFAKRPGTVADEWVIRCPLHKTRYILKQVEGGMV